MSASASKKVIYAALIGNMRERPDVAGRQRKVPCKIYMSAAFQKSPGQVVKGAV